ncbi:MAG: hypothetical protein HN919_03255 [Verrucomicrobia bacterium]|jgi:hypothetical protein|nr:hypothetical protein [Verrucomicrobiota bacterium]MBT7065295.1 hypothetical protein [Verrucomicrobiota bacterium]MBT7698751.1 hypothetical protein [Verrucomicrobiota bacterium]
MARVSVKEQSGRLVLRNRWCEISVDLAKGLWSGVDRTTDTLVFKEASFRMDQAGTATWAEAQTAFAWRQTSSESALGRGTTVTLTATPEAGYAPVRHVTLRLYPNHPFVEIGWGVTNRFSYPVRIKDVEVLYGGELFSGQTVEQPRVLRSGAGAEPNVVEKGWQIEALNGALLTYKNRGVRRTLVAGGLAYAECGRRVEMLKGHKHGHQGRLKGDRPNLNLACWDPQGKRVAPGETYMSPDTCYLDFVTADPFTALEAYGQAMRTANGANPNAYDFPTLCGWMVSTKWLGENKPINNSVGLVEQTRIAREQGLMNYTPLAVRLEPDTYCYGNHGDTQQGWWDNEHWRTYGPGNGHARGDAAGSLRKPYDTFAKFCKAVAELGGIPFTYFQSSMPSNDFAVAHPEWMLNGDISQLHVSHAHHRPLVRYDYTHPAFRAHCLKVWRRLRKAGLKGVKFDYPETAWAANGGFADQSFTTTSAYRELFRLCREGLGPEAFLHERNLGGQTHEDAPLLDATAGIVDIQRVWGDASHFEAEMASRMGLRWYKSRSVFLYYPDGKSFVNNGRALPAYKRRAFLTLIGFLSGRLEIGTSIGSMTDEMFHDTTRLFPVLGGTVSPRPVDMLTGGQHPSTYVYRVTDRWHQVLLINNNKSGRKTVSAPLSGDQAETGSLGFDPTASYHAFDFWSQSYVGKLKGSGTLAAELRGGEVAMISLRKVAPHPQPISTNRHIMQGMMECHQVVWSEKRAMLTGKVDAVAGETFVLTVACNGRKPVSCDGATLRQRARGLIDLVFSSEQNARLPFRLRF